jgi:cation diffusion facilitator CzcD-associated flavoprotein CzcO
MLNGRNGSAPRSRRVVIIGAGPGGLCMGYKLLEAGFHDFVILDKADGVGGTWRHNQYPGAACDVPALLYSYSFAMKKDWSRPYAEQPEILEYLESCVERFGLDPHLRLGTGVRSAHWDDECTVWRVITDDGDELVADAVVSAMGMFNELNRPQIPGLDEFPGTLFHSARWRHDHDLSGETVAVIGTAASTVQFLPVIAERAGRLHVFQRSPQWVLPKEDTPFTEEELAAFRADPMAARLRRWEIWRFLEGFITFSNPEALAQAEDAGRANLANVEDPDVRARLTPATPFGCQRPLSSNIYYPVYNRPTTELVTDAIARVRGNTIVTVDGRERPVDTIITATGFATTKYASAIEMTGRGGQRLADAWADGPQAYLGITTTGFPNLFMLYGPNTNNGSIIFMLECQVAYIMRQLRRLDDEGLAWIDLRADVMERYNTALQHDLDQVGVWQGGCHGYYRGPTGRIVTQWPHTMFEYRSRTLRPDPDAYEVQRGATLATSTLL